MKSEYLSELLRDNKNVILPGVGAFSGTGSATQSYVFNEYLKFNDGLLASYISNKEGISLDEAGKKLETFSGGVLSALETGKTVTIAGIGSLKKNDAGKLEFTCDTNTAAAPQKEAPIEVKPVAPPVVSPIVNKTPDSKEEKSTPPPPVEPKPVVEPKVPATEIKPVENKTPVDENKKEIPESKKEVAPPKKEKPKKEKKVKEKKQGSKKRMVWLILLILLLGGGGTAGFLFRNEINEWLGSLSGKSEAKEASDTVSSDSLNTVATTDTLSAMQDTLINEEQIAVLEEVPQEEIQVTETPKTITKEPSKASLQQASGTPGTFYVVVGCYSNEANATSMIEKANGKGLQGTNIGTYGGLIHVAVYSSSDLSDAAKRAMEINADFPNAWVFQGK